MTTGGEPSRLFTLHGQHGTVIRISDFGASIIEAHLPDRDGRTADVVLGFDSVEGYESPANAYFGATVGRVANRIANAEFEVEGRRYDLVANEPPHHLHGGPEHGFSKVVWETAYVGDDAVEFALDSPEGEEGYPARVEASARYTLTAAGLEVRYRAQSDALTPVNMTNHAYWNLAGAGNGTILEHELRVVAEEFTPCDDELIPTGGTWPVAGTALDLRTPRPVGARIGELEDTGALGYDHNFVIDDGGGRPRLAARLADPASGRVLELITDQPGLQVYSGNRLEGQRGKNGRPYLRNGGLCLEPQHHPDALHRPEFPSILLMPGVVYEHVSLFAFGTY